MSSSKSSEINLWHRRFIRQAEWTRDLRYYLYRQLSLCRAGRILDLGCGTGVIAQEIYKRTGAEVWGLDRDAGFLRLAAECDRHIYWIRGEAERLPFAEAAFDLIVTQYFWMWLKEPKEILEQCLGVLRPGGYLAALAEPDYSRREDRPEALSEIGRLLAEDLKNKGADPGYGAKLADLFLKAGLKTESGRVLGSWGPKEHRMEYDNEWRMIERLLGRSSLTKRLRIKEKIAIAQGKRYSVMPLFWAIGRKQR